MAYVGGHVELILKFDPKFLLFPDDKRSVFQLRQVMMLVNTSKIFHENTKIYTKVALFAGRFCPPPFKKHQKLHTSYTF